MAKFCTKCGNPISPDESFCGNCGVKIFNDEVINEELSVKAEPVSHEVLIKNNLEQPIELFSQESKKTLFIDKIKLLIKNATTKNKYALVAFIQIVMITAYIIFALYMLKLEQVILSPIQYLGSLWLGISILNVIILLIIIKKGEKNNLVIENNQVQLVNEEAEHKIMADIDNVLETVQLTGSDSEVQDV